MPVLQELFLNDGAYNSATYTSSWINVSSSKSVTVTVFSSSNCNINIERAVDNGFAIIDTISETHTGGTLYTTNIPTALSFLRLSIINLVTLPCDLKIQAYFFLDN